MTIKTDWRWVLDPWTVASHKRALGDTSIPGTNYAERPWVPLWDRRRLTAYALYDAYYSNAARHWLPTNDPNLRNNHREYGDAALIIDQALAALIGTQQSIGVAGAEKYDPNYQGGDATIDAPADSDPAEGDVASGGDMTPETPSITPEQHAAFAAAAEREDWLRAWALRERFTAKMFATEHNAVKKGDGVYVLGWDGKKKRVRLKVYEPDVFYPVPDPDSDDDFPRKVHVAWVYALPREDPTLPTVYKLRRITWELREVPPWRPEYAEADEPESTVSCFMSDGEWSLNDGMTLPDTWDLINEQGATWRKNGDGTDMHNLDIGVDFIPVVHIPNTINECAPPGERWGQPVIAKVLQVLDDIAATDTDFAAATATTGSPPIALSGTRPTKRDANGNIVEAGTTTVYGPGQMYHLGENGRMDVLDTSKSLDALMKAKEALLDRATANARLSPIVMGRVDPASMGSGIQLQLSLGPMQAFMEQMRLVRNEKYPLLLSMVQKFAIANNVIDGPVMDARLTFGNYLPADKAAAVAIVRELMTPTPIVSRMTCLRILVAAGFPIDDAAAEIKRVEAEDFLGAVALGDAIGSQAEVATYLGREGVEADPAPALPTIPVRPDLRGGSAGNDRPDLLPGGDQATGGSAGRAQPAAPPAPAPAGGNRTR